MDTEGERWGHRGGEPLSSPSTPWRRDLAELSQEVSRAGRAAHAACVQLGAHLRLAEGRAGAVREQQAQQLAQLEEQLAARARDAELEKTALGDRWGSRGGSPGVGGAREELSAHRRVLGIASARLAELTAALERLREEGGEKERAVAALTLQLQKMVSTGEAFLVRGDGCAPSWGAARAQT